MRISKNQLIEIFIYYYNYIICYADSHRLFYSTGIIAIEVEPRGDKLSATSSTWLIGMHFAIENSLYKNKSKKAAGQILALL